MQQRWTSKTELIPLDSLRTAQKQTQTLLQAYHLVLLPSGQVTYVELYFGQVQLKSVIVFRSLVTVFAQNNIPLPDKQTKTEFSLLVVVLWRSHQQCQGPVYMTQ